jgi:hypothetical protein
MNLDGIRAGMLVIALLGLGSDHRNGLGHKNNCQFTGHWTPLAPRFSPENEPAKDSDRCHAPIATFSLTLSGT